MVLMVGHASRLEPLTAARLRINGKHRAPVGRRKAPSSNGPKLLKLRSSWYVSVVDLVGGIFPEFWQRGSPWLLRARHGVHGFFLMTRSAQEV